MRTSIKSFILLLLLTVPSQSVRAMDLSDMVWQELASHSPTIKKVAQCAGVAAVIGITAWVLWHRKSLSSFLWFGWREWPATPEQAVRALEKAYEHDLDSMLNLKERNFLAVSFTVQNWSQVSMIGLGFGSEEAEKKFIELKAHYLASFLEAVQLNEDPPTDRYYQALSGAALCYGLMVGWIKDMRWVHEQQLKELWEAHKRVLLVKLLNNQATQADCDALQVIIDQLHNNHPIKQPLQEFKQFLAQYIATPPNPEQTEGERKRFILCSASRYFGEIAIHLR